MGARRAGGDQPHIRAARAVTHRNVARSDVADHHRNQERRDAARAAFEQHPVLVAHGRKAADPARHDHADAVRIDFAAPQVFRQPGGRHGFVGGGDRILAEEVETLRVLRIHVSAEIEILDLPGDLRPVFRGVEPGDLPDPAPAVDQSVPEIRNVVADARNHAVSGNYNTSVVHIVLATPSLTAESGRRMFLTENRTTLRMDYEKWPVFRVPAHCLTHRPGLSSSGTVRAKRIYSWLLPSTYLIASPTVVSFSASSSGISEPNSSSSAITSST